MNHIEKYHLVKLATTEPLSPGAKMGFGALRGAGGGALLGGAAGGIIGLIRKLFGSDSSLLSNVGGGAALGALGGGGAGAYNAANPGKIKDFITGLKPGGEEKYASTESDPLLKSIDYKNALVKALIGGGAGGILGGLSYDEENDDSEDVLLNSRLKAILASAGIGAGVFGGTSLMSAAGKRKVNI